MPDNICMKCGRGLTSDDMGLHRKLVNRGSKEFMCKSCLSRHFDLDESVLDGMIEKFREQGCTLFAPKNRK